MVPSSRTERQAVIQTDRQTDRQLARWTDRQTARLQTYATASTTYATMTNLNAKEITITFSAPSTRTTNTVGFNLSSYLTYATASTTYATMTTRAYSTEEKMTF